MASLLQILNNIITNLSTSIYSPHTARPTDGNSSTSRTGAHRTSSNCPFENASYTHTGYNTRSRSYSQPRPRQSNHSNHYPQARTSHPRSGSTNRDQAPSRMSKVEDKIDIKDLRDLSEINNLGAKQLKTILTRNCVDYKGIFEKEVLREKVMLLWIDYNESLARRRAKNSGQTTRSQDDLNEISEDQVCKICMEREINSVLLDCGHLVTCVECGKKLAECPICRQNIVRVARTFRA